MANLTKDNPGRIKRDLEIIGDRCSGMTLQQIADKHDISNPRVHQILSDPQIKQILDDVHRRYISHAEDIGKRFIRLTESDDKKIRLDAIKEYHKIVGIAPSHATSKFIQNVYNIQTNANSPAAIEALRLVRSLSAPLDIDTDSRNNATNDECIDVSPTACKPDK